MSFVVLLCPFWILYITISCIMRTAYCELLIRWRLRNLRSVHGKCNGCGCWSTSGSVVINFDVLQTCTFAASTVVQSCTVVGVVLLLCATKRQTILHRLAGTVLIGRWHFSIKLLNIRFRLISTEWARQQRSEFRVVLRSRKSYVCNRRSSE